MNPQTYGQCAKCGEPAVYTKLVCNRCGSQLPWVGGMTNGLARQGATLQSVELTQNPLTTRYRHRHLTALEALGVLSATAITLLLLGLALLNHSDSSLGASTVDAINSGSRESANTGIDAANDIQAQFATRVLIAKIQFGMTLSQVQGILGIAGKQVGGGTTGELGMTRSYAVYAWTGLPGADIKLTFRDDKLVGKNIQQ